MSDIPESSGCLCDGLRGTHGHHGACDCALDAAIERAHSTRDSEVSALRAEVERLRGEVVNRNRRALEGDKAVAVREVLLDRVERAERERDELRKLVRYAEVVTLRAKFNSLQLAYTFERTRAERAERERDEARAVVEAAEMFSDQWVKGFEVSTARALIKAVTEYRAVLDREAENA